MELIHDAPAAEPSPHAFWRADRVLIMSNQHVLKIHPVPLADLLSGTKTAEVRRNDRDFQVGDTVRLMEVNPETGNWTGAADHVRTISHIQTGYGLPDGICVLSYTQPFVPRNRLPGRLAIRAALPDVPGDMLDHGLFAALDAMGAQAEQQEAQGAKAGEFWKYADKFKGRGCFTWAELEDAFKSGAALATQPGAGEPIHQWADQDLWMDGDETDMASARAEGFKTRTLWTAPPAAAHGDEAVRKDAERWRYGAEHGFPDTMRQIHPVEGPVYWVRDWQQGGEQFETAEAAIDAAMRAQGDGG